MPNCTESTLPLMTPPPLTHRFLPQQLQYLKYALPLFSPDSHPPHRSLTQQLQQLHSALRAASRHHLPPHRLDHFCGPSITGGGPT